MDWQVETDIHGHHVIFYRDGAAGGDIAAVYSRDDAAFIVHAVNSHASLEARVKRLEEAFRLVDDGDWERLLSLLDHSAHGKFWFSVLTEFRAALKDIPDA